MKRNLSNVKRKAIFWSRNHVHRKTYNEMNKNIFDSYIYLATKQLLRSAINTYR